MRQGPDSSITMPCAARSTPRQRPDYPFYQSYWQHDGYLWAVTPRSFGRISLKDGHVEGFPGFMTEAAHFTFLPWSGLERVSRTRLTDPWMHLRTGEQRSAVGVVDQGRPRTRRTWDRQSARETVDSRSQRVPLPNLVQIDSAGDGASAA